MRIDIARCIKALVVDVIQKPVQLIKFGWKFSCEHQLAFMQRVACDDHRVGFKKMFKDTSYFSSREKSGRYEYIRVD